MLEPLPKPVPAFRARRLAVQLEVALCEGNKDRFKQLCRRGIKEFQRCRKQGEPDAPAEVYISAIDPRIGGILARRAKIETVTELAMKRRIDLLETPGFGRKYLLFCDDLLAKYGLKWQGER